MSRFAPFKKKSNDRMRRELPNVEIVTVNGAHVSFFLTSRDTVVKAMRRFLLPTDAQMKAGRKTDEKAQQR